MFLNIPGWVFNIFAMTLTVGSLSHFNHLVLITNIGLVMSHPGYIFYYLLLHKVFLPVCINRVDFQWFWPPDGILGIPFYFVFMNLCLVSYIVKKTFHETEIHKHEIKWNTEDPHPAAKTIENPPG